MSKMRPTNNKTPAACQNITNSESFPTGASAPVPSMAPAPLPPIQSLLLSEPISSHASDLQNASQSPSRDLLALDCSADLRTYSRNLGPNSRDRNLGKRSELSPSPFQEPYEPVSPFLPVVYTAPSDIPPSDVSTSTVTPTRTTRAVSLNLYSPTPRPPPPQFLTQSPLIGNILLAMAPEPDGADISTYPAALRAALDQCASYTVNESDETIYQVVKDTDNVYLDNSQEIQRTYKSLHTANLEAAKHFIDDVFRGASDPDGAEFEVLNGGRLRCAVTTEGSIGGHTMVYVRKAKL